MIPVLPEILRLYRFRAIYVIADSADVATKIASEKFSEVFAEPPDTGYVPADDEDFSPLFIQGEYLDIFRDSSDRVTEDDATQVENINGFVRFMADAFTSASTFPVVPQLELAPSLLVRFLVELVQRRAEVCENTKAYYFLRYPTLEERLKEWKDRGGFIPKNVA